MLKDLKEKIRRWLIEVLKFLLKKLGYIELPIIKFEPEYKTELPLITVGAEIFIEDDELCYLPIESAIESKYFELARQLGNQVIENAKFSKSRFIGTNSTVYCAEIQVIKQEGNFIELVCKR